MIRGEDGEKMVKIEGEISALQLKCFSSDLPQRVKDEIEEKDVDLYNCVIRVRLERAWEIKEDRKVILTHDFNGQEVILRNDKRYIQASFPPKIKGNLSQDNYSSCLFDLLEVKESEQRGGKWVSFREGEEKLKGSKILFTEVGTNGAIGVTEGLRDSLNVETGDTLRSEILSLYGGGEIAGETKEIGETFTADVWSGMFRIPKEIRNEYGIDRNGYVLLEVKGRERGK